MRTQHPAQHENVTESVSGKGGYGDNDGKLLQLPLLGGLLH